MDRAAGLARLDQPNPSFDVVVIGAGANGAGCLLDCASRGLAALLVERGDFGGGTSSRSSKLIHGGLRYLAQGRLGLVREALRERAWLLANAPSLVRPLDFVVPVAGPWDALRFGAGVTLYHWLAGTHGATRLDRTALARRVPGLAPAAARGAVVYRDAQFDDARLLLSLLAAAQARGATALNHTEAIAFEHDARGRIARVVVRDRLHGREYRVAARAVINAAGVWGDRVRGLAGGAESAPVILSQGAHLVLSADFLRTADAVVLPWTPDGRLMFALPWHGHLLLGTTDTALPLLPDEPTPLAEEIDQILTVATRYFARQPTAGDVRAAFAGVRPLAGKPEPGGTARVSREHRIDVAAHGLVSVSGGKWTTYRLIAEQCVDLAVAQAGLTCGRSHSRAIPLRDPAPDAVAALVAADPALGTPLHPALPYCGADFVWAARGEMAVSVADALAYRTRACFIDAAAAAEIAPAVAALMGRISGWDAARIAAESAQAQAAAARYLLTPTRAGDRPG